MVPVENFMAVIDQYRFLSESLARPVSRVVPWLELVFGTFLLLGFMTRVSAAVLTGLLGVFVALLGRAIVLGLSIADCGCFGSGIKLTPHHALLLDTALVLCSAFVFRHAPRVLSLDRRLTACVVAMLLVLTGCVTARTVPEGIGPENLSPLEPSPAGANSVVAKVGGEAIGHGELEEAATADMKSVDQKIYEIKRERLQKMVEEKLWQLEARKRGVSVEALKARAAPDDEAFMAELSEKYPVEFYLEPPRDAISLDETPLQGNPDAPITLVEFSDFECPFCGRVQPTLQDIRARYEDKVRLAFKHFPLPFHRSARQAHLAALCADEQGKFWPYRAVLFQRQKDLSKTALIDYARELGLETELFQACLGEERYAAKLERDFEEASRLGVTGTPTFFLNGRRFSGAQPYRAFEQMIEEELKR